MAPARLFLCAGRAMVRRMHRIRILAALALPAVLLTACGGDTRTAGGVTKAEAEALDEAAEIIEQQRLPAEALQPGEPIPPGGTGAAEGAATDPAESGG